MLDSAKDLNDLRVAPRNRLEKLGGDRRANTGSASIINGEFASAAARRPNGFQQKRANRVMMAPRKDLRIVSQRDTPFGIDPLDEASLSAAFSHAGSSFLATSSSIFAGTRRNTADPAGCQRSQRRP
jgi:hypothetical protein